MTQLKMYYWVGNVTGYVMTNNRNKVPEGNGDRMKYLGFTYDVGWPKKLNTGRVLYKPFRQKVQRVQKRRRKLFQAQNKLIPAGQ